MMARACYNPAAAVGIWERFAKLEETTGAPPQFLSTHPSSSSRKEKIQQWLPEAIKIQEEDSECKSTIGHGKQNVRYEHQRADRRELLASKRL